MSTLNEIFRDIADATEYTDFLPTNEVFQLLGINNNFSLEDNIELLFEAPFNPKIIELPRSQRLAAIKTCEIIIGRLFLLSMGSNDDVQ